MHNIILPNAWDGSPPDPQLETAAIRRFRNWKVLQLEGSEIGRFCNSKVPRGWVEGERGVVGQLSRAY